MQTLKTAVVVVLLLVVFYGVYEMLNRPPDEPPRAVVEAQMQGMTLDVPSIGLGDLDDGESLGPVPPLAASPADPEPIGNAPAPPPPYGSAMPAAIPDSMGPPSAPNPSTLPLPGEPGANTPTAPTSPLNAPPLATPSFDSPHATPPQSGSQSGSLIPGSTNVVNNPFVHEDVVARPTGSSTPTEGRQGGSQVYQRAIKLAKAQIANSEYHAALSTLSVWYKSPDLTPDQHRELLDLLDPLAGRVVYSREHITELPYKVRRNEKLADVAAQYNVPVQLLQKINGIDNPDVLLPGSELKVLRGPFEAEVDLKGQELTVFLDGLYAGRFPISVGSDPQPLGGEFEVRDKQLDKAYFAMDGRMIPADSPANPFGRVWLDLGREVCIHGSPLGGAEQQRGCISLSPRDADDVYSILSVGSRVRILR